MKRWDKNIDEHITDKKRLLRAESCERDDYPNEDI